MLEAFEGSQVGDEIFFVARREQGRQQDDVRHAHRERGNCGIAGIDDGEFRVQVARDELAKNRCLPMVWFDRENERHDPLSPHHEQEQDDADRRKHHHRRILDALVAHRRCERVTKLRRAVGKR